MSMVQDKILVVGATGYIGKHLTLASARLGHPTFALVRPSTKPADPASEKAQLLNSFKTAGVILLNGSLEDHDSLVQALKKVDVVISAVGGFQLRDQARLVDAIQEVGHIKRFLPSEFGNDVRKVHILPSTESIFKPKIEIEDRVLAAGIPHTFVVSNSYAGYTLATLGQPGPVRSPPTDKVIIWGRAKAFFVDEDDIATYTIKASVDPRALNKPLHIRPAQNFCTQLEVVELWEKLSGHHLEKTELKEEDVLKLIAESPPTEAALLGIIYSIFVKGDQDIPLPEDAVEATALYPDVHYVTVPQYLRRFL